VRVRARVWGDLIESVIISFDSGSGVPMKLTATANTEDNRSASDTILVLANRSGQLESRIRSAVDYENVLCPWPEKHILRTQLGPNENDHGWPSHRERARQPR
jgi:hypothetical protein